MAPGHPAIEAGERLIGALSAGDTDAYLALEPAYADACQVALAEGDADTIAALEELTAALTRELAAAKGAVASNLEAAGRRRRAAGAYLATTAAPPITSTTW